jgi:hypothetical protein
MSGAFEDYNEYDQKMFADHATRCRSNGKFCHWYDSGKYKHHWQRHSHSKDRTDKIEREHAVYLEWKELKEKQMEQELIEIREGHKQHEIDAARRKQREILLAKNEQRRNEQRERDAAMNEQLEIAGARNEQRRNEQRERDAAMNEQRDIDTGRNPPHVHRSLSNEQREIDAAIEFLASKGMHVR